MIGNIQRNIKQGEMDEMKMKKKGQKIERLEGEIED